MSNVNPLGSSIKSILAKKGWVDIPASGVSMFPLIKEGDICRFVPLSAELDLKKGDVYLFQTEDGQLIGHRYYHSFLKNQILFHAFKGDSNVQFDPPLSPEQLIGKLISIKKKRSVLKTGGRVTRIWTRFILSFPTVPVYCKKGFYYWRRLKEIASRKGQSNGSH
ncbi:hypothetical protein BEP19_13125 [Ammoniphilus oxalaticus]|uniref:Signal peptidase I n=1 Tax=Ammoniphilus oxalaticus TaxID=66863 RepID=A0A419SH81_9BACL|nr:S24/S26 family peptidase [Ammoniphilus oxalaticus]RKD23154.1 hypothetical protein BEP19_13125 [Ammoniphilus oxalaticus]